MLRAMRVQRFGARVAPGPGGRAVIAVPFDPDEAWGAKAEHPVTGTVNGRRVRGRIAAGECGWALTLSPMWFCDAGVAAGDDVIVALAPEGPQRGDLADDIAAALEANPAAAAFFDTLAQFYRKAPCTAARGSATRDRTTAAIPDLTVSRDEGRSARFCVTDGPEARWGVPARL